MGRIIPKMLNPNQYYEARDVEAWHEYFCVKLDF